MTRSTLSFSLLDSNDVLLTIICVLSQDGLICLVIVYVDGLPIIGSFEAKIE